jgi:hypothetical protein
VSELVDQLDRLHAASDEALKLDDWRQAESLLREWVDLAPRLRAELERWRPSAIGVYIDNFEGEGG